MTQADTSSLWERISRNLRSENDCLVWTKYRDECGYGRIRVNNKTHGVHRLSWIIENGPIPDGLHVLHDCDTPACANPNHLFLGTHADNMADKVAKGRHPRGERVPGAKLTLDQAQAIKRDRRPLRVIAAEYGVAPTTVRYIRAGTKWSHAC